MWTLDSVLAVLPPSLMVLKFSFLTVLFYQVQSIDVGKFGKQKREPSVNLVLLHSEGCTDLYVPGIVFYRFYHYHFYHDNIIILVIVIGLDQFFRTQKPAHVCNSLSIQDMKYVKHALSTTTRKQESRELSIQDNDYKHVMSTYFSCTQRAAQITSSVRSTSSERQAKFNSITREIVQIQTFLSLMSIFC